MTDTYKIEVPIKHCPSLNKLLSMHYRTRQGMKSVAFTFMKQAIKGVPRLGKVKMVVECHSCTQRDYDNLVVGGKFAIDGMRDRFHRSGKLKSTGFLADDDMDTIVERDFSWVKAHHRVDEKYIFYITEVEQ